MTRGNGVQTTQPSMSDVAARQGDAGPDRATRVSDGRRRRLGAAAGIAVPTIAYLVHASRFGRWIVDDAAITFAYARSLVDGHGLVQQPGARPVEAYSNPSWLVVLAGAKLVGVFDSGRSLFGVPDYVWVPKALAVALFVGTLLVLHAAARPLLGRWAAVATGVAGLLLAANPSYVIWTVSGLENPLMGFTVAALLAVIVRAVAARRLLSWRTATAASLLAVLAALTRPDGAIYLLAYPAVVTALVTRSTLRAGLRAVLVAAAAAAVPVAAFLAWRHAVFGQWLPNTATAKSQGGVSILELGKIGALPSYVGVFAVCVGAALVGAALVEGRTTSRLGDSDGRFVAAFGASLAPAVLSLLAFGVLRGDWMTQYRFATPVWVTTSFLVAVAGTRLVAGPALAGRARVAVVAVVVLALVLSGPLLSRQSQRFAAAPTISVCFAADRYGRLFNAFADRAGVRQGSLLAPDIGGTLLTSRLRVYDLAGLADPTIAKALRKGDRATLRDYVFDRVKPTFIHGHGTWASNSGVFTDPRLARDYVAIVGHTDYVRRDALRDPGALRWMQENGRQAVQAMGALRASSPLRSCGDTLRPGSLPSGL